MGSTGERDERLPRKGAIGFPRTPHPFPPWKASGRRSPQVWLRHVNDAQKIPPSWWNEGITIMKKGGGFLLSRIALQYHRRRRASLLCVFELLRWEHLQSEEAMPSLVMTGLPDVSNC